MPLSLNEIRDRARAFAKEWAEETSERAEAQSFWNEFFNVFGVELDAVYRLATHYFSGLGNFELPGYAPASGSVLDGTSYHATLSDLAAGSSDK